MRTCRFGFALAIAACVALVFVATGSAAAQAPRAATKAWVPPRTPDGQPDIQGFWDTDAYAPDLETGVNDEATATIQGAATPDPAREVSVIVDPPDGKIPYQPWAAARRLAIPSFRRGENRDTPKTLRDMRPRTFCLHGTPRNTLQNPQIVQTPGYLLMLWEFSHAYRIIPLDGSPHVAPGVKLAMGDARGRWEGNTLVVETTNLNDWDWFDYTGTFHSDATTVVERFTLVDANTIRYQFTVTDPKVFTRPWTVAATLKRDRRPADYEIMEAACVEGERGVEGIMGRDPRK